MTRVITLGTFVAFGCGALLGLTLAYGQWMLAIGALILGVGGATAVALAAPEPSPPLAPVTLGGPVVRPTIEVDDDAAGPEPAGAPEPATSRTPAMLPLDPGRPVPNAA